ncbi:MAG: protein-L-isoaspartate(D-aspartate) O-methyltransferase [Steroidobacteraceae bacterium]|nr:protein-L-isoaspartate(D-aspartate) O-methyltransferase [Nevskiaceae bacterium]MCP5339680.1 protein-L-isoaspartate(D-aspartate) O-methyltransferase [Nevskiaceae bacterium]
MTSARTRDRLVQRLRDQGIKNLEVLDRIRTVPRHIFVDEAIASRAYEDTALPIGFGQTISQPYIVARMTEALLEGGPPLRNVLEIGTGCGYQTAVLAGLVGRIFTIERIEPLVKRAKERLKELGVKNVRFRHGDGSRGWAANAPYDGILAAAAPQRIPEALLEQLAVGGRLIMPVGPEGRQELVRLVKREQKIDRHALGPVAFVPLLGGVG